MKYQGIGDAIYKAGNDYALTKWDVVDTLNEQDAKVAELEAHLNILYKAMDSQGFVFGDGNGRGLIKISTWNALAAELDAWREADDHLVVDATFEISRWAGMRGIV